MVGDHLPEQMDQLVVTTDAKGMVAEVSEELAAKVPATAGTPKDLDAKMEGLITDVNDFTNCFVILGKPIARSWMRQKPP